MVDDANVGVKSKLHVIEPDGKENFFDDTDEKGVYVGQYECKQGRRFRAEPYDRYYFDSALTKCLPPKLLLKVSARALVQTLQQHAEAAAAKNNYGTAALLSNEAAARLSTADETGSQAAANKTYVFAGKHFGVTDSVVFDPEQGKYVMSAKLRNAVKKFQIGKDLTPTGHLDFNTLYAISDQKTFNKELTRPSSIP